MGRISYIEDKNLLAISYKKRNFQDIEKHIDLQSKTTTFSISNSNSIYGFNIKYIESLSSLYGEKVFAVEFHFKNIKDTFNKEDNYYIGKVIERMNLEIENKGYYIIKIPSNNTMLLNQINLSKQQFIFAGNTICYTNNGVNSNIVEYPSNDEIQIKIASFAEKKSNYNSINKLSEASFKNHFTQYHISHVTRKKAPLIYKNWINNYLEDNNNKQIIIAKDQDKIVGFLAYNENSETMEIVLNSVDADYRGKKIYERLIRKCIDESFNKNKIVTVSTQLDNYFAQWAWINCEFKPYHSFYLMHYNNL